MADSLAPIFDKFAPAIYEYALRLGHDPDVADSIVGDAFATLLSPSANERLSRSDIRVFLYQAACTSSRRYSPDGQHRLSVEAAENPKARLFSALYGELTEEQRHVMVLYLLEDFSARQIARILGRTVNEIMLSLQEIGRIMDDHPELQAKSLAKMKKKRKPKGEV